MCNKVDRRHQCENNTFCHISSDIYMGKYKVTRLIFICTVEYVI